MMVIFRCRGRGTSLWYSETLRMRTANSVLFNVACMVHAIGAGGYASQERRSPIDATTLLSDVVCVFCGGRGGPRQSPICCVRMTSIVPRFRRSLKCQSDIVV